MWEEAANLGYEYAQYNLGICYKNAFGVEQDYNKSFYWWEKAANNKILQRRKLHWEYVMSKGYGANSKIQKKLLSGLKK